MCLHNFLRDDTLQVGMSVHTVIRLRISLSKLHLSFPFMLQSFCLRVVQTEADGHETAQCDDSMSVRSHP